jgi:hypothetical protein
MNCAISDDANYTNYTSILLFNDATRKGHPTRARTQQRNNNLELINIKNYLLLRPVSSPSFVGVAGNGPEMVRSMIAA